MSGATRHTAGRVPVIDVAPLLKGRHSADTAVALREASSDPGFIYIRNHGISADVLNAARASARVFFDLPEATRASVTLSRHHRGWLPAGGAKMADDVPTDRKESFVWGHHFDAAQHVSDHSLRGPNQWPQQDLQGFRQHAENWLASAERLARALLGGIAASLGLDARFFLRDSNRPLSRASYVYYRRLPPQTGRVDGGFGVGPHTDFGVLTILCQDQVGGLQIKNAEGEWIEAPPVDDTLIVNVGDLLERWTNGAFRSAPHRVMSPAGRDRLSLVFAFDPNPETVIDPGEVYPGAADCAEPVTCGDYLDWRFSQAFAYRQSQAGTAGRDGN